MLTDSQKLKLFDSLPLHSIYRLFPVKRLKKALGLYSLDDLARKLGLTYGTVQYRAKEGIYPPPSVTISKRSFYTAEQVEEIAASDARKDSQDLTKEMLALSKEMQVLKDAGFTQWEIADVFGVTQSTVSRLLNGKRFSRKD